MSKIVPNKTFKNLKSLLPPTDDALSLSNSAKLEPKTFLNDDFNVDKNKPKPSTKLLILAKVLEITHITRISIRLLWSVSFLTALSACSYMIFLTVSDYYSYNVVTKFETITQIPLPFPAVSICNVNPLITSNAANLTEFYLVSEFGLANVSKYVLTPDDANYLFWGNRLALVNAFNPDYSDEKL